jgi:hypothetical protein
VAVAALTACDRESPAGAPAPSAPGSSGPAATSTRSAPAAPHEVPPQAACRAIRVDGTVRVRGGSALTTGAALDGRSWVELDERARLGLRHSRTGRELVVEGPSLILPCRGGEEEFLLAEGFVTTSRGQGARPGAEVLIATPFASMAYGDAKLEVRASGRQVVIASKGGEARIEPARGATLRGERQLRARAQATVSALPDVSALIAACEREAERAEGLARAVLAAADGGETLGERAARHVEARQKARSACAVAATAAATRPESERAEAGVRTIAADRRWKAVPGSPSPGGR